jgi:hypothetical protein
MHPSHPVQKYCAVPCTHYAVHHMCSAPRAPRAPCGAPHPWTPHNAVHPALSATPYTSLCTPCGAVHHCSAAPRPVPCLTAHSTMAKKTERSDWHFSRPCPRCTTCAAHLVHPVHTCTHLYTPCGAKHPCILYNTVHSALRHVQRHALNAVPCTSAVPTTPGAVSYSAEHRVQCPAHYAVPRTLLDAVPTVHSSAQYTVQTARVEHQATTTTGGNGEWNESKIATQFAHSSL